MNIPRLKDANKRYKRRNKNQLRDDWKKPPTDKQQMRNKMYQTDAWKNLTKTIRMLHPLDEVQLIDNKVILAEETHHIVSPFSQQDETLAFQLLLDTENLLSLSKECHGYIHNNIDMLSENQQRFLKEKIEYIQEKYFALGYAYLNVKDQYTWYKNQKQYYK